MKFVINFLEFIVAASLSWLTRAPEGRKYIYAVSEITQTQFLIVDRIDTNDSTLFYECVLEEGSVCMVESDSLYETFPVMVMRSEALIPEESIDRQLIIHDDKK